MTIVNSVVPDWIMRLPLQQQTVLDVALRGPDGDPKYTPFKVLLRAYRATIRKAAYYNRLLEWGEKADSFMALDVIADEEQWHNVLETFLEDEADGSILHHYTHFMHATEILGYKHPDPRFRKAWLKCYLMFVERLHLNPETEEQMDARLNDRGRKWWGFKQDPKEQPRTFKEITQRHPEGL